MRLRSKFVLGVILLAAAGCATAAYDFSKAKQELFLEENRPLAQGLGVYMSCLSNFYGISIADSAKEGNGVAVVNRKLVELTCEPEEVSLRKIVKDTASCSNSECPTNTANTVIQKAKSSAFSQAKEYANAYNSK